MAQANDDETVSAEGDLQILSEGGSTYSDLRTDIEKWWKPDQKPLQVSK